MNAEPPSSGGIGLQAAGDAPAAAAEPEGEPAAEAVPSTDLVASPSPSALTVGAAEIRQFAGELATQLFQRWEVALQEQFRAELGLRLKADLVHRERTARDLREEVQERRVLMDNPWGARHGPYGFETWQMEQTIKRQSSELAETERQMRELRQRLQELRGVAEPDTVIVYEHGGGVDGQASMRPPADGAVGDAPASPGGPDVRGDAT